MRLLLLNPNTSGDMTARLAQQASRHAPPHVRILPATARFGCEVVASRASFAIAAHAALDTYASTTDALDGVLLACFGDPGLAALRELAQVRVLGLLEAALNETSRHEARFAIVTPGHAWVDMLEELLRASGHAQACSGVVPLPMTGLQLSRDPQAAAPMVQEAIDAAVAGGAEAVILGGSALAGWGNRLHSPVPLVDPLEAAMRQLCVQAASVPAAKAPLLDSRGLDPRLAALLRG